MEELCLPLHTKDDGYLFAVAVHKFHRHLQQRLGALYALPGPHLAEMSFGLRMDKCDHRVIAHETLEIEVDHRLAGIHQALGHNHQRHRRSDAKYGGNGSFRRPQKIA